MNKGQSGKLSGMAFVDMPSIFWLCTLIFGIGFLWAFRSYHGSRNATSTPKKSKTVHNDSLPEETKIEPLVDFEWSTTEPPVIRPFKPHYHMTMGMYHIDLG